MDRLLVECASRCLRQCLNGFRLRSATRRSASLVDAVDRVVGDAFEDMVQIELWVEAVELG